MLKSADYEPTEQERAELSRERFLTSHRAIAACSREFGRLADEIVGRAGALRRELMIEEEPDLRLTPERCIVQIGPVALTIAWLRGALDSLTDGRLLIIAWRGPRSRRRRPPCGKKPLLLPRTVRQPGSGSARPIRRAAMGPPILPSGASSRRERRSSCRRASLPKRRRCPVRSKSRSSE